MYPVLFHFGPVTIYSFGALMALAALAAAWIVYAELKRNGYDPELASTMVFAAAFGGLAGARPFCSSLKSGAIFFDRRGIIFLPAPALRGTAASLAELWR